MSGSIFIYSTSSTWYIVKWSSDLWIKEIPRGKKYFRQEMNLRRRSESIKKLQYSLNQPAIWWFEKRMSINPNFLLTTLFKHTYFWQKEADLFFPVHLGFDSSTKKWSTWSVHIWVRLSYKLFGIICHLVLYKAFGVFHYYRALVNRNVTLKLWFYCLKNKSNWW